MDRQDWENRLQTLTPAQLRLLAAQLDELGPHDSGRSPGPRLVAYIACSQEAFPSEEELRSRLASSLPEHMIPAQFVFLDELPQTPNGKVDRQALPDPDAAWRSRALEETQPAESPTEQKIAAIWAEILDVPYVGIREDFFELGGHSLLVTQLVSRLRRAFNLDLPLSVVFEETTVAGQAARIEAVRLAAPTEDSGSDADREEFEL